MGPLAHLGLGPVWAHLDPIWILVASGGARLLRFLSRRAMDKKRGRDGTKYSKFHSSNYLTHHLASISLAAVYTDAVHIEEGVDGLKQRALALAPCDQE